MSEYKYTNEYEKQQTGRYEGYYTAEEIELNVKLYEECSKEVIDFSAVEELLKRGADPLGGTAVCGLELLNHVYGDIVFGSRETNSVNVPEITKIFLRYGMNVSAPRIPYDGENSLHVLEFMPENENTVIAWKMLLDNGLDAESAAEYWGRAVFDQINVCCDDPNDEECNYSFIWMMKIVMLIASYDHVLDNDEDLRRLIGTSYNSYDIHGFRDWDNYYYVFDTSRCEKHPQLYGCVIRIYDVHTDEMVWKIGVHIDDGHF